MDARRYRTMDVGSHLVPCRPQIPRWTLNPLLPLPTPDPAESTDDAVFAKRHLKLELDEKRRKR